MFVVIVETVSTKFALLLVMSRLRELQIKFGQRRLNNKSQRDNRWLTVCLWT